MDFELFLPTDAFVSVSYDLEGYIYGLGGEKGSESLSTIVFRETQTEKHISDEKCYDSSSIASFSMIFISVLIILSKD